MCNDLTIQPALSRSYRILSYAIFTHQPQAFTQNAIHTGWLDARIAANVKAERPPWHLCVIGSAVVSAARFARFAVNCVMCGMQGKC